MFTSFDKALVGVVMGAIFILQNQLGVEIPGILNEKTVSLILAALNPILIYVWPNKFS